MNLQLAETIIHLIGGVLAYIMLGNVLYGVWQGTRRQVGRTTGYSARWLRSAWFYLGSSVFFFGVGYLGWNPLPWNVLPQTRAWMFLLGSLSYFPGISVALWGRLALGKNYFVSTGFGAQLFAEHQLIKSGPYALLRHPMYSGLILAAFGGLLLYFTWTTLFFAGFAPLLIFRAFSEERVLAAEFGEQWQEYRRHVPMFVPGMKL